SVDLSPAKMSLSAKSADFEGAKNSDIEKQKRDKEWENITLAALTGQIAAKHRCKSKTEITVHYPHVAQTNESDLQFVARLAREAGGNFSVRDRTWLVTPPDRPNRPKATIVHTEGDVSGRFTFKDRTKYKSVAAKWWDPKTAEEKTVKAGRGDPTHTVKRRFSSPAEAETLAKNTLTKLNRRCVEGELEMTGRGDLVAGAEISLEKFPKGLDGTYLAKSVSHSVSRSSWATRLTLERLP
uniref:phage late control D family protein n=1 Tax=Aminomonas paucivorans TaxID=81412 RepID=UPI00332E211F